MTHLLRLFLCFVALIASFSPASAQDSPVDRVHIQFGKEFRVPGVTLESGTYIFMPSAPVAGQIIIEIYDGDATKLMATVLAIESTLARPDDATLVDYSDTKPSALRAWFHPGNPRGYEFVYTREEAALIFSASATPVPSTISDDATGSMLGLLPIVHADDVYRGGVDTDLARELGVAALPQATDRLTLARVAILSHVDAVPSDIAMRLRQLDGQLRDVHEAFRLHKPDFGQKLALAKSSLGNMPSGPDQNAGTFDQTPALTHVLDRVRAQIKAFDDLLR